MSFRLVPQESFPSIHWSRYQILVNHHNEQTSVACSLQTFSCRSRVFVFLSDSWSLCNSSNCLCNPSALSEALSFSICVNGSNHAVFVNRIKCRYIAATILGDFIIIPCSNVSCRDSHEAMKGYYAAGYYTATLLCKIILYKSVAMQKTA